MSAQSFQIITKPLAKQYHHVAPTSLDWATEREFLYAQIFRPGNEQVVAQIEAGNEECIESVRRAARSSAAMGLTMNPLAALVYFIPRRARERDPVAFPEDKDLATYQRTVPWIITATPSYRGLAYICTHYAGAADVVAEVVFADDQFQYAGPLAPVRHVPTLDNAKRTEKNAIGAYCMIVTGSNRIRTEYVDAPTIQLARGMSKMANGLMWTKFWTEGWRKVAVRRASKLAMQATDFLASGRPRLESAEAIMQRDDGVTIEGEVPRGTSPNGEPPEDPPPAKARGMDGLKDRMAGAATRAQAAASTPTELDPAPRTLLALPAPSKHPEGSIEWWLDQVSVAGSSLRLDEIKVAALANAVDRSDEAEAFRAAFKKRKQELRAEPEQRGLAV